MTSNPYNKYEQITTSYILSVLEYNIHKTSLKGIECLRHRRDLYPNTSWFSCSRFNGENFNVIF